MRLFTVQIRLTLVVLSMLTSQMASADVLLDQIGSHDGSALAGDTYGSQSFIPESDLTAAIEAVDNFTLTSDSQIDAIEFVLDGWNGFHGPEDVAAYTVNIYSDLQAAASNLIGDVLSRTVIPEADPTWDGAGWLMHTPLDHALPAGDYFIGVLMANPYPDHGWAGIATSTMGDNSAWQVSPDGEDIYVFVPYIQTTDNLAYRVLGSSIPAPASLLVLWPLTFHSRKRSTRPTLPQ